MLHYSGKFPSLKRINSGYGGKFLQEHLFPRGYIQPKLYPPLCQVYYTKNLTKLFRFLVCEIRRFYFFSICYQEVGFIQLGPTKIPSKDHPLLSWQAYAICKNIFYFFFPPEKVFVTSFYFF